ncbi:MAG: type II toxin-antitoxin system Phd/YefM family antitoxin [Dehalococcoidia bacterium]
MIAPSSKWQLQEAKNKLSEVVRRAREEGPQTITVRGEDAVVVMDAEGFSQYESAKRPKESLYEFMQRWADRMNPVELDIRPRSVEPSLRASAFPGDERE